MPEDEWIVVPNWDKFQHYSDRNPTWIKVYTALNSKPEFERLPLGTKGLLLVIWVEYARAAGRLHRSSLRFACPSDADARYLRVHLQRLNHAGFILFAASPETEKRRDRPLSPQRGRARSASVEDSKAKSIATRIGNGAIPDLLALNLEVVAADLPVDVADKLRSQFAALSLTPTEPGGAMLTETPEPTPDPEPEPDDDEEGGEEDE